MDSTPDRAQVTQILRELQASLDGDWMDRSRWPADQRALVERWEAAELARKAAPPEET